MCRQYLLNGFQFDKNLIAHDQVDPEATIQFHTRLTNRNLSLLTKSNPADAKLVT